LLKRGPKVIVWERKVAGGRRKVARGRRKVAGGGVGRRKVAGGGVSRRKDYVPQNLLQHVRTPGFIQDGGAWCLE